MRDLEIRGAGSLLGEIQHGHLEKIGYDMYTKLLQEAISEEKGEVIEDELTTQVDISIDTYIPNSYIAEQKYKMDIYQEIIGTKNNEDMKLVAENITDRYGKMPDSLKNFIKVIMIRNIGITKGIIKILELQNTNNTNTINIQLGNKFNMNNIDKLIKALGNKITFKNPTKTQEEQGVKGIIVYSLRSKNNIIKEVYQLVKFLENKED